MYNVGYIIEINYGYIPLETTFPTLPSRVGNNAAIAIDLMICAPMMIGSSNFFKPNAKKPNPKPVKNEFLPKFSLAVISQ